VPLSLASTARKTALLARLEGPLARQLKTGRELLLDARESEPAALPWSRALPGLAALLPEGLARGELVELTAGRSSGRFACVLALLAAATAAGENAALVDLGDALDPQAAAPLAIDWARLLWVRPRDIREALAATEAALTGGLPVVALDLGLPPVPGGRGAEAMWIRLARSARAHNGLLFVAAPYRVAGPASSTVLELARGHGRWSGAGLSPRLLDGAAGRFLVVKGKNVRSPRGEALALTAS
jgi:hypothetical protein